MEILLFFLLIVSVGFIFFVFSIGKKQTKTITKRLINDPLVFKVLMTRDHDGNAEHFSKFIEAIVKTTTNPISFELVATKEDGITYYLVCDRSDVESIKSKFYLFYPFGLLEPSICYTKEKKEGPSVYVSTGNIKTISDSVYPIKTFDKIEIDTLVSSLSVLSNINENEEVWVQFVLDSSNISLKNKVRQITNRINGVQTLFENPIIDLGQQVINKYDPIQQRVEKINPRLNSKNTGELEDIKNKSNDILLATDIRIVTKAIDENRSQSLLKSILGGFNQFKNGVLNSFILTAEYSGEELYTQYFNREILSNSDIYSIKEFSSLYHFPNISILELPITWIIGKKLPVPLDIPIIGTDDNSLFGKSDFRGESVEFGIRTDDKIRGVLLLGKGATGKSTLMLNLLLCDIAAGKPSLVIDVMGNLSEKILKHIPVSKEKDIIYLDAGNSSKPFGFNLFDDDSNENIVSSIIGVMKDELGGAVPDEYSIFLSNIFSTALQIKGATLLSIVRMINDDKYRKFVLKDISDHNIIQFWNTMETIKDDTVLYQNMIKPIITLLNKYISFSSIRNIVGNVKSSIDILQEVKQGKTIIINMHGNKIGMENAKFMSSLILLSVINKIKNDNINELFMYIDDCDNINKYLLVSEIVKLRKYNVGVILSTSGISNFEKTDSETIVNNMSSLITFALNSKDAKEIISSFEGDNITENDIISLPLYSFIAKMSINGNTSRSFTGKTLDIRYETTNIFNQIKQNSENLYGIEKEIVEEKIKRWSSSEY